MNMKITITRAGGYDPRLGQDHPDNRDPALCDHDWVPIPLHRARYGCRLCRATGYRLLYGDGAIATHKTRCYDLDLGELEVTVRQTARQKLTLPSVTHDAGTAPWGEGWRRRPLPSADRQADRVPSRA